MSQINYYISKSSDSLIAHQSIIEKAIKTAEQFTFPKLGINWDIDLLIKSQKAKYQDTKDHVSGFTHRSDLITMDLEKGFQDFEITEVLIHELCHAGRWGKNSEFMNNLFDHLIFEGLAVYFTEQFSKIQPKRQLFMEIIVSRSEKDNEKLLMDLKPKFNDTNYNSNEIFYGNSEKFPYYSGYSLGYYLIKKYLVKTGKTIDQAFTDKYSDFKLII